SSASKDRSFCKKCVRSWVGAAWRRSCVAASGGECLCFTREASRDPRNPPILRRTDFGQWPHLGGVGRPRHPRGVRGEFLRVVSRPHQSFRREFGLGCRLTDGSARVRVPQPVSDTTPGEPSRG